MDIVTGGLAWPALLLSSRMPVQTPSSPPHPCLACAHCCCVVSSSPCLCPRHCCIPLTLPTPLSPRATTNYDNNVCQQTSLCTMKQSRSVNSITAIIVIVDHHHHHHRIDDDVISTTFPLQSTVIVTVTTAMMSRGWHLLLSCRGRDKLIFKYFT